MATQLKNSKGDSIYPTIDKTYILDLIYPVGSIFQSTINKNPGDTLGGTWEAINGRFLLANDSEHAVGTTGGTYKQNLITENVPQHSHSIGVVGWDIQSFTSKYSPGSSEGMVLSAEWRANVPNGSTPAQPATGELRAWPDKTLHKGESFSITPPYVSVYMWKRVD